MGTAPTAASAARHRSTRPRAAGQRLVVALGGNALLQRGEPLDAEHHRANVQRAAHAIASIVDGNEVVITHGNGPQVGLLALQAEAYRDVTPYPLDVLGAESEGMIGYLLDQRLAAELHGRQVATLLTQVVVDADDRAFHAPTKPIGPLYPVADRDRLVRDRGWTMARDGAGVRRVVASPTPRRIVELGVIQVLLEAGVLVVCAGGGGIPVVAGPGGDLHGVEAVIDKDATAALLAEQLHADALLILTDVSAVRTGWGSSKAHAIRQATPEDLQRFSFATGSMGPKIDAARRFVARTGRRAAIGRLDAVASLLGGHTGTQIVPRGELRLEPAGDEPPVATP